MHPKMHLPSQADLHSSLVPKTHRALKSQEAIESISARLQDLVIELVAQVRRECCDEFARDPKALRAAVLRLVRRELPLRRCRPNDPRIDNAMRTVAALRLRSHSFR